MRGLVWLLMTGVVALGQPYRLGAAVVDEAGRRMTGSGYQLQFSLAQSFASGILVGPGYLGSIGFWYRLGRAGGVAEGGDTCSSFLSLETDPSIVRRSFLVSYRLPEDGELSLRLLDRLGAVVTTLAAGRHRAGQYRVRYDAVQAARLADGVYFVQLRAAGRVLTRKLVVLR